MSLGPFAFGMWVGKTPARSIAFWGGLVAFMVFLAVFVVPAGWERDRAECEALNPGVEVTATWVSRRRMCLYADGTFKDPSENAYIEAKARRKEMYGVDW